LALKRTVHVSESRPSPKERGAMYVECEVTITQAEPVWRTDLGELIKRVPGFSCEPPSAFAIAEPGKGVEQGVVVWADGEAMQFKVIADVSNDAQFAWRKGAAQAIGKFCATDAARK
jgi:hypothetical protein